MMKWTVFMSGGTVENPWDKELILEGSTINDVLKQLECSPNQIDGIIRSDVLDDML